MELEITSELLTSVLRLPKRQREKVMGVLGVSEFNRCAEDPVYWLDAAKHVPTKQYPGGLPYVFTKDPHKIHTCDLCGLEVNEEKRVDHLEVMHREEAPTLHRMREVFTLLPSLRPFPMFEYMEPIIHAWMTSQYFAVEKSRDMSATWLLIALHTWDAMFHGGRQEILQSEDAFKTLELVQRAMVIYENTPKFLRDAIGPASYSKTVSPLGDFCRRGRVPGRSRGHLRSDQTRNHDGRQVQCH